MVFNCTLHGGSTIHVGVLTCGSTHVSLTHADGGRRRRGARPMARNICSPLTLHVVHRVPESDSCAHLVKKAVA